MTGVSTADAVRVCAWVPIIVLCAPDGHGGCTVAEHGACPSVGKRPDYQFCPAGKNSPISDPILVAAIYAEYDRNIGISLEAAGLVDVDVDVHPGKANGHLEHAALARRLGPRPESVAWESGRGGTHELYRRSAGELRKKLAAGVEMLASGLVVVPPSLHASGRQYGWTRDPWQHDIAELPSRWVQHARKVSTKVDTATFVIDSIPSSVEVVDPRLLRLLDTPGPNGDISSGDFAVAARAVRLGYPDRAVAALIADHRQRVGDPKGKAGRVDYLTATVTAAKAAAMAGAA